MSCAARNSVGQAHRQKENRAGWPFRLHSISPVRILSLFIESLDRNGDRFRSNLIRRLHVHLYCSRAYGYVMCLWVGGVKRSL